MSSWTQKNLHPLKNLYISYPLSLDALFAPNFDFYNSIEIPTLYTQKWNLRNLRTIEAELLFDFVSSSRDNSRKNLFTFPIPHH